MISLKRSSYLRHCCLLLIYDSLMVNAWQLRMYANNRPVYALLRDQGDVPVNPVNSRL